MSWRSRPGFAGCRSVRALEDVWTCKRDVCARAGCQWRIAAAIALPGCHAAAQRRRICSISYNQDTFRKLGWFSVALFCAGLGAFFLFGRGPVAAALSSDRNTRDVIGWVSHSCRRWPRTACCPAWRRRSSPHHPRPHGGSVHCACSAIAGVVATNIVIAVYVYSAFGEDPNTPAPGAVRAAALRARARCRLQRQRQRRPPLALESAQPRRRPRAVAARTPARA